MTRYRALEKIEYRDKNDRVVVVPAGKTFDDPPKEANISELVKHKAVERVGGKE